MNLKTYWHSFKSRIVNSREHLENGWLGQSFPSLKNSAHYLHFTNRSVPSGIAIGVFCAFMLIPFQTVIALILALLLRANIPLSLGVIWINNPFTVAPIYYLCYKVGALMLNKTNMHVGKITLKMIRENLHLIWQPFLLGTFICGSIAAAIAYFVSSIAWKMRQKKKR